MLERICSIPDCARPFYGRGYCSLHWKRWYKHGDPLAVKPKRSPVFCSVEGCSRKHCGHGYCEKHMDRFLKYGDPLFVTVIRDDVERRFWSKVDKSGECWLWTGALDPSGYGQFQAPGHRRAHRWIAEQTYGPIPAEKQVCHHCDNPACVRPDHLYIGTPADNYRDRVVRKTGARGERHAHAKLTWEQVTRIRQRYAQGDISQEHLATEYGVTQSCISRVIRRAGWN